MFLAGFPNEEIKAFLIVYTCFWKKISYTHQGYIYLIKIHRENNIVKNYCNLKKLFFVENVMYFIFFDE